MQLTKDRNAIKSVGYFGTAVLDASNADSQTFTIAFAEMGVEGLERMTACYIQVFGASSSVRLLFCRKKKANNN
jgi:hypothetical protein